MSVVKKNENDGKDVTICIDGRFDFSNHKEFREAYIGAANDANYTVDLTGTEYMDSSALGMLLLLREHAGGEACNISIIGCCDEIAKILTLSNFNEMFDIK